jgi:hypothetical protein
MSFFLHLGVRFENSDAPDTEAIETVLNKAKDWYRYAPNCWIVYTSKSAGVWSNRLRELPAGMEAHASFLICVILLDNKENRSGWLPRPAWEWIKKSHPLDS